MSTLHIDTIRVGPRHRKGLGSLEGLVESIRAVGLLHPVVVTPDGLLVAGARRLAACRILGWAEVPVQVVDLDDLLRAEHDENVIRKDFLPSEAVAIAAALREREEQAAKARQGTRTDLAELPGKFPEGSGRANDHLGAAVGLSGRTLAKAAAVVEAATANPERCGPLVERMDRTGKVNGAFLDLQRQRKADAVEERIASDAAPTGLYETIVVDPPWAYEREPAQAGLRAALDYPSMSMDELRGLQLPAAADCVLWLWTTNAMMGEAWRLAEAWGFVPKTILTWDKVRLGLGFWLRNVTEHCILAVKGSPPVRLTAQTTLLKEERREHSRKPEAFYALVEGLCPGRRLEMFARQQRAGWDAHGIEQ